MKTVAVLKTFPKDASLGKILKALSSKYQVDCYVWDRQRDYVPILNHENIRYVRCRLRAGFYDLPTVIKTFLFGIWLFFKLLFARIDYIHAIDLVAGLSGWSIARIRRKHFVYQCLDPYYVMLPAHWPKILGAIARRLENFLISQADTFIITDLLRMPQHEGAHPRKVVEIANVPIIEHPESAHDPLRSEFIVGYVGALIEGRGLLTLIDAAGELDSLGVVLVIGGYGPIEDQVQERSKKYQNVRVIGEVPNLDVLKIEESFDLFVYVCDPDHTGHKWVSPNKLFESMALKKPIIVAAGTLVATRVNLGGNGLIVPYGSKEDLKRAILKLKNDPQLAMAMGERGKSAFETNWRHEIMEARLLECYMNLGAG